jgi:hypothetical protein
MMNSTHGSLLPPIQSRQQNYRSNNHNDYGFNTTANEQQRMQNANNLAISTNSKSYTNLFQ